MATRQEIRLAGKMDNPDNPNDFWPSIFTITIPGEHPLLNEPVVNKTDPVEYMARYNAAIGFVKAKGPEFLNEWWNKCKCHAKSVKYIDSSDQNQHEGR